MNTISKSTLALLVAGLFTAASANAQITLDNSAVFDSTAASKDFTVGASGDFLVIAFESRNADVTAALFGSQSLTSVGSAPLSGDSYLNVFALSNPTTGSAQTISTTGGQTTDIVAISFQNVASLSFLDSNGGNALNTSTSVTGSISSAGNGLVGFVGGFNNLVGINSTSGATQFTAITPGGDPTSGQTMIGGAYDLAPSVGNITYSSSANVNYPQSIMFEMVAIPEPGTFALFAGALGLCLVLARRRRA